MAFNTTYKQLFEVKLLHNYFLNDGTVAFSSMNPVDQQKRLKPYDILEFVTIVPTRDTIEKMRGYNILFKTQKSGFSTYTKLEEGTQNTPFIVLPDDLNLKFILKLKDSFFGNYTNLAPGGTEIFYFGNSKPSTEGNSFKYIPKNTDNELITDEYKLSTNGSKAIMETLTGQQCINVFAVIELKMIGDDNSLNILTVSGDLRNQLPIFKIHFNNRQTFWRYKRVSDDTEIFTTAATNPLTKFGFIEVEHNGDKFPNPNANQIITDNNNFFSDIYI